MGIELPDVADVERAMAQWRADDPRFGALVERYGDAPRALRHYGLILWDQGQPANGARALTAAVTLAPLDAALWNDLAGALNASGQLPQAAACMEASLLRDRTQADGWLRLGSIRNALGDAPGAEMALMTALAIDPASTDARLSLGLVCFHGKRFAEAARHLQAVLLSGVTTPAVRACYGQALSHLGDFAGAAAALREALDLEPGNPAVAKKLAQMRFMADLVAGHSVARATASCQAVSPLSDKAFETIARQSFHLLSAFGHDAAALRLGEARLAAKPDDPEQAYMLAILKGDPIVRAPDRYVQHFFDQFAGEFDTQLVGVLGYKAFQILVEMVDAQIETMPDILDLGCGTGLAGPLLAKPGRRLVGVDLSPGMLDKARERGCYDALIAAEAGAYLDDKIMAFDLIFAADVLIYVGRLDDLMAQVAHALKPGGIFAFTIETTREADLILLPSGRFAHRATYARAQGEAVGLTLLATKTLDIRYETHGFVAGDLIVMRR